jgi:2-iminobutanoate/2-iminopropanoate deaminase
MQTDRRAIEPSTKAADTGAYSSGVLCEGWLHISGHASIDLKTGSVIGQTIEEQTLETLRLIEQLIAAAGGDRNDIVKCSVHLENINDFDRFNEAYRQYFEGCTLPARTTVGSQLPGIMVEIDAVAYIPAERRKSN